MNNIKIIFIVVMLFCYSSLSTLQANPWKECVTKVMVIDNRTIKEIMHSDTVRNRHFYSYTVSDIYEYAKQIRQTLPPFDLNGEYTEPRWSNYQQFTKETDKLHKVAYDSFYPNCKGFSDKQLGINMKILCTNEGKVCCYEIISKASLLNVFTSEELIAIFDKISCFVYTTPLVKHPDEGYWYFSLGIYKSNIK